jgi:hypothetical protein
MKGVYICKSDRIHIYRMAVNLHYTADEIFYILFDNDPNSISLVYLMKLVVKLRNDAFAIAYTAGPRLRLGRNRMLSRLEALCLVRRYCTFKKVNTL